MWWIADYVQDVTDDLNENLSEVDGNNIQFMIEETETSVNYEPTWEHYTTPMLREREKSQALTTTSK